MSNEDLEQLAAIITKPNSKTENRKIIVILIIGLVPCIFLGADLGNWQEWRRSTESRVTHLENILNGCDTGAGK